MLFGRLHKQQYWNWPRFLTLIPINRNLISSNKTLKSLVFVPPIHCYESNTKLKISLTVLANDYNAFYLIALAMLFKLRMNHNIQQINWYHFVKQNLEFLSFIFQRTSQNHGYFKESIKCIVSHLVSCLLQKWYKHSTTKEYKKLQKKWHWE